MPHVMRYHIRVISRIILTDKYAHVSEYSTGLMFLILNGTLSIFSTPQFLKCVDTAYLTVDLSEIIPVGSRYTGNNPVV